MPESTIMMTKSSNRLEPALKRKAFAFLEKLAEDDSAPGLHIEPIVNAADKKVRTGRVDQGYRAVLFKLTAGGANTYVFHGVWPHDDAIAVAIKTVLTLNPVNGIAELRVVEPAIPTSPAPTHVGAVEVPVDAAATPGPETQESTWSFPVSDETLVAELGVPAEIATAVVTLASEDELLDFAAELPGWQGQALVDLATGLRVQEVRDQLQIVSPEPTKDDSDAGILAGLRHPAARMEFAEIEGAEELRRVIEGGDFGAWKVFLHPQQRKLVERAYNGSARVSGGAGTGKTVVVLHRARWLARRSPESRILLTTYTRNLADALALDLKELDPKITVAGHLCHPGVYVSGIDALASAVLRRAGTDIVEDVGAVLGQGRLDIHHRTPSDTLWKGAIDAAGNDLPDKLRSVAFLSAEYGLVVLPARITTREEYLLVRRPGRGARLNREQRMAVWAVFAAYRLNARMAGSIDFEEAAAIAAHHLDRTATRVADHALVDEGQDLTPAHWQLLRASVAEGPDDLFVAEDGHQRIYGHRLVLSHFGIRTVGRSRRLTLNYRTTAENLAYAVGLLDGTEYRDLEDEADRTDGYRSARRGPRPIAKGFDNVTEELDFTAATLRGWLDHADENDVAPETIAVLVRDRYQRDRVVTGLADRGVSVRGVDREAVKPGEPVVMTMHRAKGTEFTKVILFGIDKSHVPAGLSSYESSDADRVEALGRERSLLYVAASRARDELVVTWGGPRSPLLPQSGLTPEPPA